MLVFVFMFCLLIGLPLVLGSMAILTEHQRKMAQMRLEANGADRTEALERRVAELAELIHQQTIALDTVVARTHAEPERIDRRVSI